MGIKVRRKRPLILTALVAPLTLLIAGCAALPDLPRDGDRPSARRAPITADQSVEPAVPPPRGHILFFRVSPADADLLKRIALLNPMTIDEQTGRNGYWHVGMSLGDGRMIHAYGTVRIDRADICGPYDSFDPGATERQTEWIIRSLSDRLGEPYDLFEALTKGGIDDARKPICTSLLVDALESVPDEDERLSDLLRFIAANRNESGFLSANAWAAYFTHSRRDRA